MNPVSTTDVKFCHQCGQPISRGDHFCGHCGTSLQAHAPAAAVSPIEELRAFLTAESNPDPGPAKFERVSHPEHHQRTAQTSHHVHPPFSAKARPRHRGKWIAAGIGLLIAGLVGIAFLPDLLMLIGPKPVTPVTSSEESPADNEGWKIEYVSGPPLKVLPAETLQHAGGVVSLPARSVSDLGTVSWEPVETPKELTGLPLTGPVMKGCIS